MADEDGSIRASVDAWLDSNNFRIGVGATSLVRHTHAHLATPDIMRYHVRPA